MISYCGCLMELYCEMDNLLFEKYYRVLMRARTCAGGAQKKKKEAVTEVTEDRIFWRSKHKFIIAKNPNPNPTFVSLFS